MFSVRFIFVHISVSYIILVVMQMVLFTLIYDVLIDVKLQPFY
jgi:hypothetical protein